VCINFHRRCLCNKNIHVRCQSSGPEAGAAQQLSTSSSQPVTNVAASVPRGSSSDTETLNELMANLNENMNRQGVSTESKGICAACSKPIIGQVISLSASLTSA